MIYQRFLIAAVLLLTTTLAWPVAESEVADGEGDKPLTAPEQVRLTTQQVMDVIDSAQGYYEKDPERFFDEIEKVLEQVVDFDSFARGVMGKYASRKRYESLSDEGKAGFRQQVKRFSDVFREGLVQTYAKGLLAFGGTKIEVMPLAPADEAKRQVTVLQKIYGSAEQPYLVNYKMHQNRAGDWKLRNVTIEAINLGKVYQGQFYSSMKQYDNDVDKVIDNWRVNPGVEAEQEIESQSELAPQAKTEGA